MRRKNSFLPFFPPKTVGSMRDDKVQGSFWFHIGLLGHRLDHRIRDWARQGSVQLSRSTAPVRQNQVMQVRRRLGGSPMVHPQSQLEQHDLSGGSPQAEFCVPTLWIYPSFYFTCIGCSWQLATRTVLPSIAFSGLPIAGS